MEEQEILLECNLNRENLPTDRSSIVYLAMSVFSPPRKLSTPPPRYICLLIDTSSSMRGEKILHAKNSAEYVVDKLEERDYLSIVAFSTSASVLIEGQHVKDKEMFKKCIQEMRAGGSTSMYEGLKTAFNELQRALTTYYGPENEPVRRIILLSDGQPTDMGGFGFLSRVTLSDYIKLAKKMREVGISIICCGIGRDYNEDLLSTLADYSGGIWRHISSPSEIKEIFSETIAEMGTVIRVKPEIIINPISGVEIDEVYMARPNVQRIPVEISGREIKIPLQDIKLDEKQIIVARMLVPPKREGKWRLAKIRLSDGGTTESVDVIANFTSNKSLWGIENNAYPRNLFMVTQSTIFAQKGIGGDTDSLKKAETQLKTLIQDKTLVYKEIKEQATLVLDSLRRTTVIKDAEERKKLKYGITVIGKKGDSK